MPVKIQNDRRPVPGRLPPLGRRPALGRLPAGRRPADPRALERWPEPIAGHLLPFPLRVVSLGLPLLLTRPLQRGHVPPLPPRVRAPLLRRLTLPVYLLRHQVRQHRAGHQKMALAPFVRVLRRHPLAVVVVRLPLVGAGPRLPFVPFRPPSVLLLVAVRQLLRGC